MFVILEAVLESCQLDQLFMRIVPGILSALAYH